MRQHIEHLLGDFPAFLEHHWGKAPFLVRAGKADGAARILTLQDIDDITAQPATRPPYLQISRGDHDIPEREWTRFVNTPVVSTTEVSDVDAIAREVSKGATLFLHCIDDYEPSISALCRKFEEAFRGHTKAVAFVTPPGQQSLHIHYDLFEGFILQTHGTKEWRVYEPLTPMRTRQAKIRMEDVGEPVIEAVLRPGDCLYVPWGAPHYAVSQSELSCHVTFMVHPEPWSQFLARFIQSLIPTAVFESVIETSRTASTLPPELAEHLALIIKRVKTADIASFVSDELIKWEKWPASPTLFETAT